MIQSTESKRLKSLVEEIRKRHLMRKQFVKTFSCDQDRVGAPDGNQNARKERASKNAYMVAKNGGKHAGWYRRMRDMPTHLIEKSKRSHEKTVEIHKDKISNPSKYVSNWSKMKKKDQERLIRKWKTDVKRNQEQAYIERGILEDKQNGKG